MSFPNKNGRDLSDRSQLKVASEFASDSGSQRDSSLEMDASKVPEGRSGNKAVDLAAGVPEKDPVIKDLEAVHGDSGHEPPYSVFTKRQKRYIVFMAAWGGFFSQLSTNIYFPALNVLSKDYNVSSELINLTVTAYMIFQGLAPTIYGDLADMAGRRPAYITGFAIYIGANIGLALQSSYPALFVLRCLQSSGSSGTIALGNGVVADIATSSERGIYMGLVMVSKRISFFPHETNQ